jgi:hypothetical protein
MTKMTAAERYAARRQRQIEAATARLKRGVDAAARSRRWGVIAPNLDEWERIVDTYNGRGVV